MKTWTKAIKHKFIKCPVCRYKYRSPSCFIGGEYFYICITCINKIFPTEQQKQDFYRALHEANTIRGECENAEN